MLCPGVLHQLHNPPLVLPAKGLNRMNPRLESGGDPTLARCRHCGPTGRPYQVKQKSTGPARHGPLTPTKFKQVHHTS